MKTIIDSFNGAVCTGAVLLLIVCSASGQNLYVANYSGGTIVQVTPTGGQSIFASGQNFPTGLAINSAGDLFVANCANNVGETGNITEITPGGVQTTFASGIDPTWLAFDSSGNLFETDYRSGNIYEFAPNGTRSTFSSGFNAPVSMTFDSTGNLFVGSGPNGGGLITKVTPGGVKSGFASGLDIPQGLVFDSAGNLYESDETSSHIFEFTPGGTRSTFASLTLPNGAVFDSSGNMFVATQPGPIVEITPGGVQSTITSVSGVPEGIIFAVPEPSTQGMFGLGAVVLFAYRRCKRSFSRTAAQPVATR